MSSDKAAVWVTNWDTERGSAITYKKGSKYLLANAFMLAYDYGQPHIYSGYYFDNSDDGAPGATETSVPDMECPTDGSMTSGTWQCAERWTAIRGMIGFHNAVNGTDVTNWKAYDTNVLGFGRGDVGYLALNNSADDSKQTFQTSLPAGEYCNVYATGDCSATVTVKDDGTFDATLAKNSAIAIYAGATKDSWTGTTKSDPSDPDLSVNDETKKATADTSRTIYYKLPDGWKQAYLHYGIDGWAEQGPRADGRRRQRLGQVYGRSEGQVLRIRIHRRRRQLGQPEWRRQLHRAGPLDGGRRPRGQRRRALRRAVVPAQDQGDRALQARRRRRRRRSRRVHVGHRQERRHPERRVARLHRRGLLRQGVRDHHRWCVRRRQDWCDRHHRRLGQGRQRPYHRRFHRHRRNLGRRRQSGRNAHRSPRRLQEGRQPDRRDHPLPPPRRRLHQRRRHEGMGHLGLGRRRQRCCLPVHRARRLRPDRQSTRSRAAA